MTSILNPRPPDWSHTLPLSDVGVETPYWIDQDLTVECLEAIQKGGCASGAYMPAVTYSQARRTMSESGEEIAQYLFDQGDGLPDLRLCRSWSQACCDVVSQAVELWANSIDLRSIEREHEAAVDEWVDTYGWEAPTDWAPYLTKGKSDTLSAEERLEADRFIEQVRKTVPRFVRFAAHYERGESNGDWGERDYSMYVE